MVLTPLRLNLLATILLLAASLPARADRDIVYAARYYAPPGSRRTSHFHLYRINPDGTGRTQLTYGMQDDSDPHWSPDGRHIAFMRGDNVVCVVGADGGDLREMVAFKDKDFVNHLGWLADGQSLAFVHNQDEPNLNVTSLWPLDVKSRRAQRWADVSGYEASPDGHRLFLDGRLGACLLSLSSRREVRISDDTNGLVWLGRHRLIGVIEGPSADAFPVALRMFDVDGPGDRVLTLRYSKTVAGTAALPEDDGALLPSSRPNTVIYAMNEGDSTVGTLSAFFLVHLPKGVMRFLAEGQFLAWSPDGSRFCTAPGRGSHVPGAAVGPQPLPLQIEALGGKLKTITPGLVWVTAADWRRGTP